MAYYRNPSRSKFAKAYRAARRDWYKTHYGSDETGFRGSKYWTGSNRRTRAAYNAWLRSQPGGGEHPRDVDAYNRAYGRFNYYLQQRNKRVARFKDGVASVAFEPRVSNPSRSISARESRGWNRGPNRKMYRARTSWDYRFPKGAHPSALSYPKYAWYLDSRLARISSRVNKRGRR